MTCCTLIETLIFTVGLFYLLRWFVRLASTVKRIYWGTPVNLENYGPKGAWAVVTGCTDGIGKAIALELARRGFNLALVSRNIDKLNATAKEAQAAGSVNTRVIVYDFCEDTSISGYQSIAKKLEGLDIAVLVNNVGIGSPTERTTKAVYREIAANCYPVVLLTQQLIGMMKERYTKDQKRSVIINLASQAALTPSPFFSNYSGTKVFDDYFSKSLYYELKAHGVDVLSVLPGMVATAMTKRQPDIKEVVITPEECAVGTLNNATSFLCYGGTWHEITGFLTKSLAVDLLPQAVALKLAGTVGEKIYQENIKKFGKSE